MFGGPPQTKERHVAINSFRYSAKIMLLFITSTTLFSLFTRFIERKAILDVSA